MQYKKHNYDLILDYSRSAKEPVKEFYFLQGCKNVEERVYSPTEFLLMTYLMTIENYPEKTPTFQGVYNYTGEPLCVTLFIYIQEFLDNWNQNRYVYSHHPRKTDSSPKTQNGKRLLL